MRCKSLIFAAISFLSLPLFAYAESAFVGPRFGNTTPERAEWFRSQQNQRGGQCCGDETKDGYALTSDKWRIVSKPFWDSESDPEPKPGESVDPKYDYYVRYKVEINGRWENVHTWQLADPKRAKGALKYIRGSAEVWYRLEEGGKIQIFCFLPGTLT